MITAIEGRLYEATPLCAAIEAGGLTYEVHIPVTTAEKLPPIGERVRLHTLAVYREDQQTLYGFHTREERDFFRLLTEKVSGIGPKTALSLMSKLSVGLLHQAIAAGDVGLLSQCPGIGKKTAERLVVELRDLLGKTLHTTSGGVGASATGQPATPSGPPNRLQDAVGALIVLGYKPEVADAAIRKSANQLGADATTESLIRTALR